MNNEVREYLERGVVELRCMKAYDITHSFIHSYQRLYSEHIIIPNLEAPNLDKAASNDVAITLVSGSHEEDEENEAIVPRISIELCNQQVPATPVV